MGQLEKYGLYVLCLVIFLILGVAIWGEPASAAGPGQGRQREVAQQGQQDPGRDDWSRQDWQGGAAGNTPSGPVANMPGGIGRGGVTHDAPPAIDLNALMRPVEPPQQPAPRRGEEPRQRGQDDPAPEQPAAPQRQDAPPPARPTYTVVAGDTIGEIAQRQLGSARHARLIQQLNPRVQPERLRVGQELLMPTAAELAVAGAEAPPAAAGDVRVHTIARGDTLEGLARRFLGGPSRVGDIKQLNPGVDPTRLRVGQTIYLPAR